MTRLVPVIVVAHYLRVAGAFSGNVLTRGDVVPCDHRLRSTSNGNDSSEKGETVQERIERTDPVQRRRRKNMERWGVELQHKTATFPSTFEEVADEAFRAISGTLRGVQRPDPNVASNAMHRSVLDYRPTQPRAASRRRWVDADSGDDGDCNGDATKKQSRKDEGDVPARMGIEIDGAAYLLDRSNDEGRAMRILSLQIAKRLCALPWDEEEELVGPRSVAVYFNSVEQSLLASRELSRWKGGEEGDRGDSLDGILIHCLGHDSLPSSMVKTKSQQNQKQTEERILLIVKPTDYDTDSLIHVHGHGHRKQPTIQANVVDKLQSLLFQASASSIPAVVLSPRLEELSPLQSMPNTYKRTGPSGFEQSGYQDSATYGGMEPPAGPTSWLLRDLVPPVYVWAGCANNIGRRQRSHRSVEALFRQQRHEGEQDEQTHMVHDSTGDSAYTYYSRVALTQSTMEAGHSWHMFAVKESLKPPRHSSSLSHGNTLGQVERDISYHYIGSSLAARGRPSSRIMNDVFEEFCEASRVG